MYKTFLYQNSLHIGNNKMINIQKNVFLQSKTIIINHSIDYVLEYQSNL